MGQTVYIVLDTGAQASLISLAKALELKLKIEKTSHQAIQVDGTSSLKVVGELHTTFEVGNHCLYFDAIVVQDLGVDILAGTAFHKDNDVYARMSNNTIVVGGSSTFIPVAPATMELNKMTKPKPIATTSKVDILKGESTTSRLPAPLANDEIVAIESMLGPTFCKPQLANVSDGQITIENTELEVMNARKGCQILKVSSVSQVEEKMSSKRSRDKLPTKEKVAKKLPEEILRDIDQTDLTTEEKLHIKNIIEEYSDVFQLDLPGYNGFFGDVSATYEFATASRPVAQRNYMPNYGQHGEKLYNIKCREMIEKGVLIDPYAHYIQPALVNNSWIVKKQHVKNKSWDKLGPKDVRLVTAFDQLNKFLRPIPVKVVKYEKVYTTLAKWNVMGELDFTDMYWQMPFKTDSPKDMKKLAYLCIRTPYGTMTYSRGAMGLLGMDSVQEELTDRLLGDLVEKGNAFKIADNVYFGGADMSEFLQVFTEIIKRCSLANLKVKPSKIKLKIRSADILGLHWSNGFLSPSPHKIDPLTVCDKPKTVKGLRSFLGAVRWHEICLPGARLANATTLLDEQTISTRKGTDEISWTESMTEAFFEIQNILKSPSRVAIPRQGDLCYIANDACQSLPAMATKLFLKRPGVDKFLPSFNFGFKVKTSMSEYSPCELEAYSLNKGINKLSHFLKSTGNSVIALVDSKATYTKQNSD